MADPSITALVEENGRVHIVELVEETVKIKGIGVFNPKTTVESIAFGKRVQIGSKIFTHLPPRLPELVAGMKRRAQTIGSKDAGVLISRLGIGPGDVVLEAGLGSGGQSMHLARVLGESGHLITVEPREEHSEVGLENLKTLANAVPEFPKHSHVYGRIESSIDEIQTLSSQVDAVLLDVFPTTLLPSKQSLPCSALEAGCLVIAQFQVNSNMHGRAAKKQDSTLNGQAKSSNENGVRLAKAACDLLTGHLDIPLFF